MWVYYLLLLLAVALLAASNCFSKQYQKLTERYNNVECSLRKTIPMSVISVVFFLCINGFKLRFTWFSFVMSVVLAVVNVVAQLVIFKAYEKGSVSLFTMFQMQGGMILPFIYGVIFANNNLSVFKIIGIAIMIIALILPHVKDGEERGKSKLFLLLCVAIFFLNGSISIISYVHSNSEIATDNNSFLFLLYLFIGVLSAIVYAVYCIKNKDNMFINKPEFSKRQHILFWFYIYERLHACLLSKIHELAFLQFFLL